MREIFVYLFVGEHGFFVKRLNSREELQSQSLLFNNHVTYLAAESLN